MEYKEVHSELRTHITGYVVEIPEMPNKSDFPRNGSSVREICPFRDKKSTLAGKIRFFGLSRDSSSISTLRIRVCNIEWASLYFIPSWYSWNIVAQYFPLTSVGKIGLFCLSWESHPISNAETGLVIENGFHHNKFHRSTPRINFYSISHDNNSTFTWKIWFLGHFWDSYSILTPKMVVGNWKWIWIYSTGS